MNKLRKIFTSSVVVCTIVWAAGLAAFVPVAQAATLTSGDLIKASLPAVYYYASDGKRYVFPDEKTYKTWYADFSTVKTITDTELAAIAIGGNVTYRPGVKMVKITTDPKVYAVSLGGTLHWIQTEAIAAALYGADWATKVQDVPDPFFVNYTVGTAISDASQYSPSDATASAPSINVDLGLGAPGVGGLSASIAADTPAGATLPLGATGVKVLKFVLSGNTTLSTLTLKTEGVGNAGDIAAAYLYDGNTRLTSGRSFNTSTKELEFNLNMPISGSKTLTLVIDVALGATASNQHAFAVINVNGTAMSGVKGNTFTMGAQAVSNVTVDPIAKPSNPKVGTEGALIAEVKITGGTNDSVINQLTFTQIGSIGVDELKNFVLKQGTTTVATASAITSGDKIVLPFSTPFSLLSGAVRNFSLYADVGGRPGRTISTYIDETSDISITDALYGFGAAITNNLTSGAAITITTEGGVVTVAFNGPITGDVSKGGRDVVLFKFALTAASSVEVRNAYVQIDGGGVGMVKGSGSGPAPLTDGTAYFTDIKIVNVDTGKTVSGPIALPTGLTNGETNSGLLTLPDDFTVDGTMNLAVTADLSSTEDILGSGEFFGQSYTVTFGHTAGYIFAGGADIKYSASNDYVATGDIVPNIPITGNPQTILASALDVNVSGSIGNNTHVKGATGAQSVAFVFTAGSDSAIAISKLVVDPRVDTNNVGATGAPDGIYAGVNDVAANNVIASAKLWQQTDTGYNLLSGPKSVQATIVGGVAQPGTETVTFDNFNATVPAGDSIVMVVSLDFTTTATNDGGPDDVAITIRNAANIVAEDKDNNSVTATSGGVAIGPANIVNDETVAPVVSRVTSIGTFAISSDTSDTTYRSRLVQMGSSGQKALKVKAQGTREAFKVTEARFNVPTNPNNVTSVTITYPTNKEQTTFESKTSVLVGAVASFAGMNWYVTQDTDSYLTATVAVNTQANGATSGAIAASGFSIDMETQNDDLNPAGNNWTKVIGLSSGARVTTNAAGDADCVGNVLLARKTIITVDKNAASPSGSSIPGINEYLIFNVTNTTGGTATLYDLTLRASSSDNAGSDWVCSGIGLFDGSIQIFDAGDPSTNLVTGSVATDISGCSGFDADATDYLLTLGGVAGVQISSGSTKTFKVKADTSSASAINDDTFRLDLVASNDDDIATPGGVDWQWDDSTGVLQNGYKVENMPVYGGNFIF